MKTLFVVVPFVACLLLCGFQQAPSSTQQKPGPKVASANQQKADSGKGSHGAARPIQPAAGAADKDPTPPPGPRQNDKVDVASLPPEIAVKQVKDSIDRTIMWCTIILTLVGSLGTWAAVKTLRQVKRQADTLEDHKTKFDELARAANSNAEASILHVRAMQEQITEMSIQSALMASTVTHTEELAKQAVSQTKLTQKQLELSQRPWISVTRIPQQLRFQPDAAFLGCVYKLGNCGASVAWNISIWAELVPTEKDWHPVLQKLQEVMTMPVNANSDYGYVLFPNEIMTHYQPAMLPRADLDISIKNDTFKGTGKVGFYLVGCIDYRSHASPDHYRTSFVDLVGYTDSSGRVMGAFDPTQQIHSPIVLTPHGHGASAT